MKSAAELPDAVKKTEQASREYYDEFAAGYEARRAKNVPGGYHDMLDELEADYVARFGTGKRVLEVGCGTGLVLERIQQFASLAQGIDLSPQMLKKARERGLDVREGSATELPFDDATFDVTCSFKVLAHVPEIERALAEMARVTKPGGAILAEFYNPQSFRGLLRLLGPAKQVGQSKKESDVFTRFDSPRRIAQLTPAGCRFEGGRGVRIVTPTAHLVDQKPFGPWLRRAERLLCDTPLRHFAGFYIAHYHKLVGDRPALRDRPLL